MLEKYRSKVVTADKAAEAIKSGDWVDFGFGSGFPELMDAALAKRKGAVTDVRSAAVLSTGHPLPSLNATRTTKALITTAGIWETRNASTSRLDRSILLPCCFAFCRRCTVNT